MASKTHGAPAASASATSGDTFDAYHRWLGIPPAEQPANHYRLLGLALFESDPNVIESATDRQMAHVRTYAGGQHSAASQRLLNELAAAKLCLLNPAKKAAYDGSLSVPAVPSQPSALPPAVMPPRAMASPIAAPMAVAAPAYAPMPAMMVAGVGPVVAAPAQQEPSLATERWLANERSKAAFYRLVTRSIVAILGAVPACIVGYSMWQKHQAGLAIVDRQPVAMPEQQSMPTAQPSPVPAIEQEPVPVRVVPTPQQAMPVRQARARMAGTINNPGDLDPSGGPIFDVTKTDRTQPEQTVERIAEGLSNDNPVARRSAIDKLARVSNDVDAASASTALAEFVRHEPDAGLKGAAVRALGALGGTSEEAISILAEIVSGDTPAHVQFKSTKYPVQLRREALQALEQIGPAAQAAIPVVLRIMELAAKNVKGFHDVFCGAADCLARIGDGRKEVVQSLTKFVNGRGFNDPKSPYLATCKAAAERALAAQSFATGDAEQSNGSRKTGSGLF